MTTSRRPDVSGSAETEAVNESLRQKKLAEYRAYLDDWPEAKHALDRANCAIDQLEKELWPNG
jgi:hypothetical protein